jgi:hypothetical protein
MSRFKVGLALVVIVGTVILIAVAMRPRPPGDSDRKAIEQAPPGESASAREKKLAAKPAKPDSDLRNFVGLPNESDRVESNAPRMQSKQIKMH